MTARKAGILDRIDSQLKLFISYSRQDTEAADALVGDLEQNGFEVTIDRRDLPYGEKWQKELQEFIQDSDTVIWLVSPASVGSSWVKWELGEVQRTAKRLVPVVVSPTPPESLPESLGTIHLLPADGAYVREEHLEAVVRTLRTDRAWQKAHTRLGISARTWIARERPTDLLLRGQALTEAEDWRARRTVQTPAPDPVILELISASQERAKNRQKQWIAGLGAVGVVLAFLSLFAFWQRGEAIDARAEAEDRLIQAQTSESNALATLAQREISEGDYGNSVALAALAMPSDPDSPDARPVTIAAQQALYDSYQKLREVRVLRGHASAVTGALQLASGRILTWDNDNVIRLWTATGLSKAVLPGQAGQIAGARELEENRILIWFAVVEEGASAPPLVWSPDHSETRPFSGNIDAPPGDDRRENDRVLYLEGYRSAIRLNDGRMLIWPRQRRRKGRWYKVANDLTAQIESADGSVFDIVRGHDTPIKHALELPDGRILTYSTGVYSLGRRIEPYVVQPPDGVVRIWNSDGSANGVLKGHEGDITGLLRLRDGRVLTWSTDRTARIWDVDGAETAMVLGETGDNAVALSLRDGRMVSLRREGLDGEFSHGRIISWGAVGPAQIWTATGEKGPTLGNMAVGAAELADGRILTWSDRGGAQIWSVDGALTWSTDHSASGALALRDGGFLTWDGSSAQYWNADGTKGAGFQDLSRIKGALELDAGRVLTWSGDEFITPINITPSEDEVSARIWNRDGRAGPILRGHQHHVTGAVLVRDGLLLTFSDDETARIWDLKDASPGPVFDQEDAPRGVIQWPDGRLLFWNEDRTELRIANRDNPARLWNLDGSPGPVLANMTELVTGGLMLRDGRSLTWGASGTTAQIWNPDGTPGPKLDHHSTIVGALQFDDGRIVTWGGETPTARIWPEGAPGLIDWTRTVAERIGPLSQAELCEFNLAPDSDCLSHVSGDP